MLPTPFRTIFYPILYFRLICRKVVVVADDNFVGRLACFHKFSRHPLLFRCGFQENSRFFRAAVLHYKSFRRMLRCIPFRSLPLRKPFPRNSREYPSRFRPNRSERTLRSRLTFYISRKVRRQGKRLRLFSLSPFSVGR